MAFNFQRLDNLRIAFALLAAVITGGAGLYGVATNARDATAASYETLAPEINELKEMVARLESENRQMKQALAIREDRARAAPPVEARSAPRRQRSPGSPGSAPAPRGGGAGGAGSPPAETPGPQSPPGPPPETAPPAPPPSDPGGVLGDIQKRIPIDFEKAKEVWKRVKDAKK